MVIECVYSQIASVDFTSQRLLVCSNRKRNIDSFRHLTSMANNTKYETRWRILPTNYLFAFACRRRATPKLRRRSRLAPR